MEQLHSLRHLSLPFLLPPFVSSEQLAAGLELESSLQYHLISYYQFSVPHSNLLLGIQLMTQPFH